MRILQISFISEPAAGNGGHAELSRGDKSEQIHAAVTPAPKSRYYANLQMPPGSESIKIDTNRMPPNGFFSAGIHNEEALAKLAATLQECLENQKDAKRIALYLQVVKLMAGLE
jgi:hypothetical protein